jgi:hypothetical protein
VRKLAYQSDDPAYRAHVSSTGAWNLDCTCRTRPDGKRYFTCHNLDCEAEGRACGSYCRPCFERVMARHKHPKPHVVTLCGSTRFRKEFEEASKRLGLEGKVVLNVSCFGHDGDLAPEECIKGNPTKDALDELHKRKIDMSDSIFVINVSGYIGESTRSEIEYAEHIFCPVEYLVPAPESGNTRERNGEVNG